MQRFLRNLSLRTDGRTDDGRRTTDACAMTVALLTLAKNVKMFFYRVSIPSSPLVLNISLPVQWQTQCLSNTRPTQCYVTSMLKQMGTNGIDSVAVALEVIKQTLRRQLERSAID